MEKCCYSKNYWFSVIKKLQIYTSYFMCIMPCCIEQFKSELSEVGQLCFVHS